MYFEFVWVLGTVMRRDFEDSRVPYMEHMQRMPRTKRSGVVVWGGRASGMSERILAFNSPCCLRVAVLMRWARAVLSFLVVMLS